VIAFFNQPSSFVERLDTDDLGDRIVSVMIGDRFLIDIWLDIGNGRSLGFD